MAEFLEEQLPFTVYIDDSGTGGALWDWDGKLVDFSNSLPIITVAAVAVHDRIATSLKSEWQDLRQEIANALGISILPPIHMRLMYGHELPRKYHAEPNPYLSASPEQRLIWIEKAVQIIHKYCGLNQLFVFSQTLEKNKYFSEHNSYYQSKLFKKEYDFFRSQPLNAKPLRAYHNVAANPHVRILGELLFNINKGIKKQSDKKTSLVYDCNPASKGFDVMQALRIIQQSGHLNCISSIREDNELNSPLIQIADVCCYRLFRRDLFEYRRRNLVQSEFKSDSIMDDWAKKYPVPLLGITPRLTRQDWVHVITIHYEIARAAMAAVTPHGAKFANSHFVTIPEFLDRCHDALRRARDDGESDGIGVMRNQSL